MKKVKRIRMVIAGVMTSLLIFGSNAVLVKSHAADDFNSAAVEHHVENDVIRPNPFIDKTNVGMIAQANAISLGDLEDAPMQSSGLIISAEDFFSTETFDNRYSGVVAQTPVQLEDTSPTEPDTDIEADLESETLEDIEELFSTKILTLDGVPASIPDNVHVESDTEALEDDEPAIAGTDFFSKLYDVSDAPSYSILEVPSNGLGGLH